MEAESQEESPLSTSSQLSGIRALPSEDDDIDNVDIDFDEVDFDIAIDDDGNNSGFPENPTEYDENDDNSESRFNSYIHNVRFESGEDEFESFGTPLAGPDEGKRVMLGQVDSFGSWGLADSPTFSPGRVRAKVTSVEEDDENEEVDVKGDGGVVEVDRSVEVGTFEQSRVPGVDECAKEGPKVDDDNGGVSSGIQNDSLDSKSEEHASSNLGGDVELSNKKNVEEKEGSDAKNDESFEQSSVPCGREVARENVDECAKEEPKVDDSFDSKSEEDVSSNLADVGGDVELSNKKIVEEKEVSVAKSVEETSSVEESTETESMRVGMDEVKLNNDRVSVEDPANEGKTEDMKDFAEDSTPIDVEEVGEKKDPGKNTREEVESSVEKSIPSIEDSVVEKAAPTDSNPSESDGTRVDDVGDVKSEVERTNVDDPGYSNAKEAEALSLWENDTSFEEHEPSDEPQVSSDPDGASSDEEGERNELFDSATIDALLKTATNDGSDSNAITITSQGGSRFFSVEHPSLLRSVRPGSGPRSLSSLNPPGLAGISDDNLSGEERNKLEHVHQLRVKFLRLVFRLGQRAEDSVAAQVLYRLALLPGKTSPVFSVDNAKQTAFQLEHERKGDLDFSLNVLVLGKTGVGKSATINSIFGEEKVKIGAFEPQTSTVHEISGIVNGVRIRVIDAPGLKYSGLEQGFNRKVLASVKNFMKKSLPDVMLYVDRLDSQSRDLNDVPMLKTITGSLGSSIWQSAIVTLTHASCAPPDGFSYEVFVAQRSRIVQHSIGQAVGDYRLMNSSSINPVALVENHHACRKSREGQRVLPNGQAWKPQLLLLCYSLKILSEASFILNPQDTSDHRKLFGFRTRPPPLPYLLSSLLQARAHPKLDSADSDIDLDALSESDKEEEDEYEYDQLPPFKPLRKTQVAKLTKEQGKAYLEEYDYRLKLLQKKQWREELKRMREVKKSGKLSGGNYSEIPEDFEAENVPSVVQVPLSDMILPPFDSDNSAYRYRFLEPTSPLLARPVLDPHGWDHDCGYDGVNVEQSLGIAGRYPSQITVQVTKDKRDFNLHLDSAISNKHGENGSSVVGFDIQTIGKQLAYIVRGESKFKNMKTNTTAAGVTLTFVGENMATAVKLEDHITLNKRLVLVGSTGTVRSQKDAAYGANLEVRLREPDYPIGQDQSSLVLSLVKWRGDLAVGTHLQSQFSVGRSSKVAVRFSLNNKLSGQLTVRTSSSDHIQLALAGLIPLAVSIYRKFRPDISENYSIY